MGRGAALILAGALLLAAGCGSDEDPATPPACLGPPATYLEALGDAPGEVLLDGATPISACLVADQEAGALATAGESMVAAATRLNRELRREFDRQRAVRLGYLVGAVREGASATGIHGDLVLRVEGAARFTGEEEGTFPARFERAFGEGHAAGQERG